MPPAAAAATQLLCYCLPVLGAWPVVFVDVDPVLLLLLSPGIAWDHVRQRLFVTGKNWPRLFEVKPEELDSRAPENQQRRRSCWIRS